MTTEAKKKQHELLQTEENKVISQISHKKKELYRLRSELQEVRDKILAYKAGNYITVTDHAMMRYFERALGFDLNAIKKEIVSDELKKVAKRLGGDTVFTVPNKGYRVVMQNYKIVTITDI